MRAKLERVNKWMCRSDLLVVTEDEANDRQEVGDAPGRTTEERKALVLARHPAPKRPREESRTYARRSRRRKESLHEDYGSPSRMP